MSERSFYQARSRRSSEQRIYQLSERRIHDRTMSIRLLLVAFEVLARLHCREIRKTLASMIRLRYADPENQPLLTKNPTQTELNHPTAKVIVNIISNYGNLGPVLAPYVL